MGLDDSGPLGEYAETTDKTQMGSFNPLSVGKGDSAVMALVGMGVIRVGIDGFSDETAGDLRQDIEDCMTFDSRYRLWAGSVVMHHGGSGWMT